MRKLLLLCGALVMTSCSYHTVRKDSFGTTKTYAVVSIYAQRKIRAHGNTQGMGTVSGLVKAAKKDAGTSDDVSTVLEDGTQIVLKALHQSRSFRLLPHERVAQHPAYVKEQPDDPNGVFLKFKPAKGYKYFNLGDKEKLSELARKLKVDGVIVVQLDYGFAFNGVAAAGLIAAGKHHGSLNAVVAAYDRSGEVVWSDMVSKTSEKGIGTLGANVADFPKLRPLLLEATSAASNELVAKLDESVSGPTVALRTDQR